MIEIYDYQLRYLKSYPFEVETLIFDAEVRNSSTIRMVQLQKDANFVPETDILINYYVYFRYDSYNYLGCISSIEVDDNSIKLSIYLNYDITNIKFTVDDLMVNMSSTLWQMPQKYFQEYLTTTILPAPNVIIEDNIQSSMLPFDEIDLSILNAMEGDLYDYPTFTRKMAKRGEMVNISLSNKSNGEPAFKVRTYIKDSRIIEIDARDKRQVSNIKYSFQDDTPNKIRFLFKNETLGKAEATFVISEAGLFNVNDLVADYELPRQFIADTIEIDWDKTSYNEDLIYSFALDYMAFNYSNEITFETTKEELRMLSQDGASTFDFFELLNFVVAFYPDVEMYENRPFFYSYISKLEVKENIIIITLGASRKRLTDKLKRRSI